MDNGKRNHSDGFHFIQVYVMSEAAGRGNFPAGDFPVKLIYRCIWFDFYGRRTMVCSHSLSESLLLDSNPIGFRLLETSVVTN